MTKTPVESIHIPAKEDNADGLLQTRIGIQKAEGITVSREEVQREMRLIEREVKAIMRSIQELGQGSLARGAIRAFQKGILDIPFSPSIYNRNQLITVKDCDGAIRFFNPELLPLPEEIADFHMEKVQRRMTMERVSKLSEMLEKDLTRIWKNDYLRWPLDAIYVC